MIMGDCVCVGAGVVDIGDRVEGVPVIEGIVVGIAISKVGYASPMMDRFPSARRASSLVEINIICRTSPGGSFSPMQ